MSVKIDLSIYKIMVAALQKFSFSYFLASLQKSRGFGQKFHLCPHFLALATPLDGKIVELKDCCLESVHTGFGRMLRKFHYWVVKNFRIIKRVLVVHICSVSTSRFSRTSKSCLCGYNVQGRLG